MKISKKEALVLAKVLHQHNPRIFIGDATEHEKLLSTIAARIDRFILVDEADADCVDDDYNYKDSPDKESEPEDVSEEDDEEADDDADEDEDEQATHVACGDALHDLKPASTKDGQVEFEALRSSVDLLVAGEPVVEDVTYIRRTGRSLEVKAADGSWTSFEVKKFPKGWAAMLPASALVEVQA